LAVKVAVLRRACQLVARPIFILSVAQLVTKRVQVICA